MGIRTLLAGITLPNEASVRFHESQGFKFIGIYENVGHKFNQWHSVGWWQKPIGNMGDKLFPIVPFNQITESEAIQKVLMENSNLIK